MTITGQLMAKYNIGGMGGMAGMGGVVQCKYCGARSNSIANLTAGTCPKGGYHVPLQGKAKSEYTCQHCGRRSWSLQSLTSGTCPGRQDGGSCVPL